MKHRMVCLCILILGAPLALAGQSIQALLDRIEKLEKRVAELEGAPRQIAVAAAAPTAGVQPAAPSPPPGAHQDHNAAATGAGSDQTYPAFKLSGFSDVNFSSTDAPGAKSGFTEGQFILHMTSALSPRVSFFGEMSFTARADAGTGTPPATGFNAEIERSIIRFDQSDHLKLSFGRYHTPINYWNTAFHHGQWLQTTISRPEMTQFGGRFIPVHFVGGLVEGSVPAGGLNVNYNVGMGNGRGSIVSRGGDAGDVNNNRAWLVNLFVKPDKLFGLQAGGSVYRDLISLSNGRNYYEWISSGHLVWNKENPEVIAEVANINHNEAGKSFSTNSQAFYVQLAYRLPAFQLWKPYYRFEYIHAPRADGVFSVQGFPNLAGSLFGVRYDISTFAAIKAEYRNIRRAPGVPRANGAFFQTSFTF